MFCCSGDEDFIDVTCMAGVNLMVSFFLLYFLELVQFSQIIAAIEFFSNRIMTVLNINSRDFFTVCWQSKLCKSKY